MLVTGSDQLLGQERNGALGAQEPRRIRDQRTDRRFADRPMGDALESSRPVAAHICFRDNNATVKCLGANNVGQLGNATNANSSTPVQVAVITAASAATRATQVVSGANHSCALLDNSNVKCWGVNNFRQLGTPTNTVPFSSTPVDVPDLSNNITQLASMADHTCGIHSNGDVSCWGANSYGQLGDGTVAPFKGAVDVDRPRRQRPSGQHRRSAHLRADHRRRRQVLGSQPVRPARQRQRRPPRPSRSA